MCIKHQKTAATNGVVQKKIASEVTAYTDYSVFLQTKGVNSYYNNVEDISKILISW